VVHAVFKYASQSGTVCYAHGPSGYRGHAVNVVTQSGVCSGLGVGSETGRRLLSQTRTPLFQRTNNARLPQRAADKGGGLASEGFPVVTLALVERAQNVSACEWSGYTASTSLAVQLKHSCIMCFKISGRIFSVLLTADPRSAV
jgi:hypothetical protein